MQPVRNNFEGTFIGMRELVELGFGWLFMVVCGFPHRLSPDFRANAQPPSIVTPSAIWGMPEPRLTGIRDRKDPQYFG